MAPITLTITVINTPTEFPIEGLTQLELEVQGKKRQLLPEIDGNKRTYQVPIDFHPDGRPKGEFVNVYGDKRPFVYLQWWGCDALGRRKTFRRIKLYWDLIPPADGDRAVTIEGTDPKGCPACSTARVAAL
jgi:hypothetical protein